MWICRLLHQKFSLAKLVAVSTEKVICCFSFVFFYDFSFPSFESTKLQAFVANLLSSGQFSRESDLLPFEDYSVFDFPTYFQHFSAITSAFPSFGQTLLVADKIPTTMKLLDG